MSNDLVELSHSLLPAGQPEEVQEPATALLHKAAHAQRVPFPAPVSAARLAGAIRNVGLDQPGRVVVVLDGIRGCVRQGGLAMKSR